MREPQNALPAKQLVHHFGLGWMLFDWDHKSGSKNLDPTDAKGPVNWRATVWEIHPITSMEVLPP